MRKILRIFVLLIAISVFCFSAFQIYDIFQSRFTAKSHYNSYQIFVVENTESTEKKTDSSTESGNKNNVININFNKLTKEYPQTVGWLHFENIEISYPVMQSQDNSYYLDHLPDGTENASGSIFADFRNYSLEKDSNYIIYGHNMKNDTMFGLLDKYNSQDFYNENSYFYYLTPKKQYKVNIIAGCMVNSDSEIYRTDLKEDEMVDLVKNLTLSSTFKSKTNYKKGQKIITLSTCAGTSNETRYVLIGVIS